MAAPIYKVAGGLRQRVAKNVCRFEHTMCSSWFSTDSYKCASAAAAEHASLRDQFTAASQSRKPKPKPTLFMTSERNPVKHKLKHVGMFYTVPPDVAQSVLSKGMHREYYKVLPAFNEMSLMVRRPAVEIFHYLRTSDYSTPIHRYLLYGTKGSGKSMCLAHVMHFCHSQKWFVLHVPWAAHFNRYYREFTMSTSRPGRVDLPTVGIEWLQWFLSQNGDLLKTLDLKTTSRYEWSRREVTEEGSPLKEIIDLGMTRSKYSNDCVAVVLKEIKSQAAKQNFKVLVAVDGVNSFWQATTIKLEDKTKAAAENLTLVHNFLKLLKNDWTNGAVVCTVDALGNPENMRELHTPRYLLDKKGFDVFDPFIPIQMEDFTDKEIYSQLEYYIDRKWIQNEKGKTEEGKQELIFLSGRNPGQLRMAVNSW